MLILLSGPIQAGKTTACRKVLHALQANGLTVAGLLTPPLVDDSGAKIGISALDVRSDRQQALARLVRPGEAPTVGVYRMDNGVLAWAQDVLASSLGAGADWIVVDEIGPLELRKDAGFASILEPLADPVQTPNAIVIVRESLVDELAGRLGRSDTLVFCVTLADRDTAPARLLGLMRTKMA